MSQTKNENTKDDANDFTKYQSDLDKAKDERLKDESEPANKKENLTVKTDVPRKKTGGGKQDSPGM